MRTPSVVVTQDIIEQSYERAILRRFVSSRSPGQGPRLFCVPGLKPGAILRSRAKARGYYHHTTWYCITTWVRRLPSTRSPKGDSAVEMP